MKLHIWNNNVGYTEMKQRLQKGPPVHKSGKGKLFDCILEVQRRKDHVLIGLFHPFSKKDLTSRSKACTQET